MFGDLKDLYDPRMLKSSNRSGFHKESLNGCRASM